MLENILDKAYRGMRNTLLEPEAYSFLKTAGFNVPDFTFLKHPPEKKDLKKHSSKLVMKIVSQDILHKTESGCVMFVPNKLKEVKKAYYEIFKNASRVLYGSARLHGVMLTDFIPGLEERNQLLVSCRHDNYMGPVISIGQGGIYVELDDDVSSRIVPASEKELTNMLHETRISQKILGYRNKEKLIEEKELVEFLKKLNYISYHFSELDVSKYVLEDLEINPLAITQGKLLPIDCLVKFRKKRGLETSPNTQNLDSLLNPKSIAVIGASSKPKKLGHITFRNLLKDKIPLYAVNVKGKRVLEHKIYRSVKEIGKEIDLAVVTIPAKFTLDAIKDMSGYVKTAILVPGGFSELGEKGKNLEEEIKKIAGEMRVIGPNTVGIISPSYNSFFTPKEKLHFNKEAEKNVSLVTQSGSMSVSFLDMAHTIGLRYVVSCGNMVDVDLGDLVYYLNLDKKTKVIAVYAESLKNARKFYNTIKYIDKPLVIFKAGKSKEARKATTSHTGAIADDNKVFDIAIKQVNAVNAENFQQFLDYCKTFSLMYDKEVKGNTIALASNAGGALVNAADELRNTSLELAEFNKETINKLDKFSDHLTNIQNPLDLAGMADNGYFIKTLECLLQQDSINGVVLCIVPHVKSIKDGTIASDLEKVIKNYKKPVVVTHMAGPHYNHMLKNFDKARIPCYETAERAVKSLDAFVKYKLKHT